MIRLSVKVTVVFSDLLYLISSKLPHRSYGNPIFSFLGTSVLFSIVATQICILTSGVGGFLFLHTLSSIYYCRFFKDGHSDLCEMIPHGNFDLYFSNNQRFWASFYMPFLHLLWRNVCPGFLPVFSWLRFLVFFFSFLILSCMSLIQFLSWTYS